VGKWLSEISETCKQSGVDDMPIFDYLCDACGKRFSALVGVLANAKPPICPRCGGRQLTKQVARFARLRTEEETLESLADETAFGDIENDPKAMRRWVREMGRAMEEDLDEDFEAAMEEEMSGKAEHDREAVDETVY
jgi:putative FmdB family regulatory protein